MLNGRTVLIVEEEFLIALDIQRMLETHAVGQTLFARTAAEAAQLLANWSDLALAVIEIRDGQATTHQLVNSLCAAGVPVIVTSSNGAVSQSIRDLRLPVVTKPIPEDALASALSIALAASD